LLDLSKVSQKPPMVLKNSSFTSDRQISNRYSKHKNVGGAAETDFRRWWASFARL
tara:strand:+ start:303 stop:467 length:165 start_codon:yes stop_codon:yes gene_type:complete